MNFEEEFYSSFGDKYRRLSLKNAVVNRRNETATITFLYPSTTAEISPEEKKEIIDFFKDRLPFEKLDLKVKFMKVYLEEKLILKAIETFFLERYKLVSTYLKPENIKITVGAIDVGIEIELSSRLNKFFVEHNITSELAKFLQINFLTEFIVTIKENSQIVDEVDIENVEMKTSFTAVKRYKVEVIKEFVGKDFVTKPEYLSTVRHPKEGVIVAGFVNKVERRDFLIKKGKREGEQKAYFTFELSDDKGKIDCIYFCPKKYEKPMSALEDYMYVLAQGDARLNKMGKLCLYVEKLALANRVQEEEKPKELEYPGKVVEIEKLSALEQDNMFGNRDKYNRKIMGKQIVVFDIETTGLDDQSDQIIELGAVKIDNGNIIEKFSTFVKPTKSIPREVSNLTGITNAMVKNAPPIEFVIRDFYDFTRGCVLSGHNIIGFDIKFIRREGENVGLDFDNDLIDTMNEARVARLKISRFNLGTVTKALGISLEGAHRAWNDAFATAQVLLKLNEA